MTDSDDPMPGREEIGSVSDEAVKLLGALSGWARQHGSDMGHGAADAASAAAEAMREVNEHLATGAAECRYCPICRVVHVVRDSSPEVRSHLAVAGVSLMQAAAALLATQIPEDKPAPREDLEHIDLDDEWPE